MKQRTGQGMLEVIVAIGITIASIVTTIALIMSTLTVSNVSQQQIVALNLAREGIELVREIRDSNWLAIDSGLPDVQWNTGLAEETSKDYTAIPTFSKTAGTWSLDFVPNSISEPITQLWRDDLGFYNQFPTIPVDQTPLPQFHRLLTMNPVCWDLSAAVAATTEQIVRTEGTDCTQFHNTDGDPFTWVGVEAHSEVLWTEHGRPHTTQLIDTLYDWKA